MLLSFQMLSIISYKILQVKLLRLKQNGSFFSHLAVFNKVHMQTHFHLRHEVKGRRKKAQNGI